MEQAPWGHNRTPSALGFAGPRAASELCTSWSTFLVSLLQTISVEDTPPERQALPSAKPLHLARAVKLQLAVHSETRHKGAPGLQATGDVVTPAPNTAAAPRPHLDDQVHKALVVIAGDGRVGPNDQVSIDPS